MARFLHENLRISMRKISALGTLLLLVPSLLFGLAAPETDRDPGSAQAGDARLLFVMVPKGGHPYYEPVYRGFHAAAGHYGVRSEVDAPPRFDVTLQVKVIEDLVARRVDGRSKVITFDAPAPSSEALTYIGTDNQSAGYEAGRRMAQAMGGRGKIAVLQGGLSAAHLNLR